MDAGRGIADLRILADALERGEVPPADVAARIACGLRRHLANPLGWPLSRALGLEGPRGWPWWRVEVLQQRNDAIRALAPLLAPGASTRRQAYVVRSFLQHYQATRWRRREPPRDRAEALAAEALASGALPCSIRRFEQILRNATTD